MLLFILSLIINRVFPEGQMSVALAAMKIGDSIRVQGPFELKEVTICCIIHRCQHLCIATAAGVSAPGDCCQYCCQNSNCYTALPLHITVHWLVACHSITAALAILIYLVYVLQCFIWFHGCATSLTYYTTVPANALSHVQLRQDYEHIIMLCAGTGITPMLQLSRCHINQQRQLVSLSNAVTQYYFSTLVYVADASATFVRSLQLML
jgi:hypothetical protein